MAMKQKDKPAVTLSHIARQGISAHRFDAAETTDHNRRHWASASAASANAAANSSARETLRNRARYEAANNSYAKGMVMTLANDTIGRGPRLQILPTGRVRSRKTLNAIEKKFAAWAAEIRLAEKLKTMRVARAVDGEAFAIIRNNPRIRGPVKLDLELIEAESVADHVFVASDTRTHDGITYDEFGNPVAYSVIDADDQTGQTSAKVPAEQMIHWYRKDRPGQRRGVSELAPALELFAQLRRYTLAVLGAAETAADMAMVIYSDMASGDGADVVDPMDTVELEARLATTIPYGWKVGQVKAEQPTTTYAEFKKEIINEIARCLNMPFNIAAGNSAGYNFASGQLDHQVYFKSLGVDQFGCATDVLSRITRSWFDESQLIEGFLPQSMRRIDSEVPPPHQWFWDGRIPIDPLKYANANKAMLATGEVGLPDLFAQKGKDYEIEMDRNASSLGLTIDEYRAVLVQSIHGPSTSPGGPESGAGDEIENEDKDES